MRNRIGLVAPAFLTVLIVAAAIRLYGIDFGLPFLYDLDEPIFVDLAFRMVETGDLNPHWFGHPGSLTIYSLAAVYWLYGQIGLAVGWFVSPQDFAARFALEPSTFYLLGRWLMAAFGVALVALTYAVARRVAGLWPSLLAMAVVAVAPLAVEYSRLIRTDSQLAVLMLAVLWFALNAAVRGRLRDYLSAGFVLGLGVATKYPAVVMAPVIGLAYLCDSGWSRARLIGRFPALVAAGAMSLVGAFVGAPYLFLDFATARADLSVELRPYHLGATSAGPLDSLGYYLGALAASVTVPGLLLALLGAGALLAARRKDAALVPAAAILFLGFLITQALRWERWAVPLVPVIAILLAVGVEFAVAWLRRARPAIAGRTAVVAASALALALLAVPFYRAYDGARALEEEHTITHAWHWVTENVPPGAAILAERYTPQLPRGLYRVLEIRQGRIVPSEAAGSAYVRVLNPIADLRQPDDLPSADPVYVMVGNDYDRRRAEGVREAQAVALYERLFGCGEKLYEALPVPGRVAGNPVRIYKLRSDCIAETPQVQIVEEAK